MNWRHHQLWHISIHEFTLHVSAKVCCLRPCLNIFSCVEFPTWIFSFKCLHFLFKDFFRMDRYRLLLKYLHIHRIRKEVYYKSQGEVRFRSVIIKCDSRPALERYTIVSTAWTTHSTCSRAPPQSDVNKRTFSKT